MSGKQPFLDKNGMRYNISFKADYIEMENEESIKDAIDSIKNGIESIKENSSSFESFKDSIENKLRMETHDYSNGEMAYVIELPAGFYLECTTPGSTGSGAIVLPSNVEEGNTFNDGTVTWTIRKSSGGGSSSEVSVIRSLSSGTKIGTITINGTSTDLYSTENTTYSAATNTSNGLMTPADKAKLDSIKINTSGNVINSSGIFGFRIDEKDSNPNTRVEYLFDATHMVPVYMDFSQETFDYGDWEDVWFVKNNKPLMMKYNGTVDYYLNPRDYTIKETGGTSDVANTAYGGNAMAQFPLIYVKRYQEGRYKYVLFSETKRDSDYKAYAHTDANGNVKSYFYWGLFSGSGDASRIRSLSGQTVSKSLNTEKQVQGAAANGKGWYIHSWSQRELIKDICILLGKSTDTQSIFGIGNVRSASSDGTFKTGTIYNMGQFFGYNVNNKAMKVFHVENFWGNQWDRTAGLINNKGTICVKMTPEGTGYRISDVTGYTDTGISAPAGSGTYVSAVNCSEFGMIPTFAKGSATTYYCDGYWANNNQLDYLCVGAGAASAPNIGGAFACSVHYAHTSTAWSIGCGLSYV